MVASSFPKEHKNTCVVVQHTQWKLFYWLIMMSVAVSNRQGSAPTISTSLLHQCSQHYAQFFKQLSCTKIHHSQMDYTTKGRTREKKHDTAAFVPSLPYKVSALSTVKFCVSVLWDRYPMCSNHWWDTTYTLAYTWLSSLYTSLELKNKASMCNNRKATQMKHVTGNIYRNKCFFFPHAQLCYTLIIVKHVE